MRAPFLVGAAVLAACLPGSIGAAPAKMPRPQTLLITSTRILKFAGDGDWIAWTAHNPHCALNLRLYSLRTHRHVDVHGRGDGISCGAYGQLALADSRAIWTSLAGAGNTELDVAVATASAAAPIARRVRFMTMIRPEYGVEPLSPPAAGDGSTLAYYRHEDGIGGAPAYAVERVARRNRPTRVFAFHDPTALAVDQGRIAAVRKTLVRGNACNCNFDPAWSPDGTKLAFVSGERCCIDDQEQNDIYVQDAQGKRARVTTDTRPKLGVAWSPDATRLAYGYYDSKFALRLAIINADGTGQHDIAAGENPSWSPDGTKLAFDDGKHILTVGVDGSGLGQVTNGTEPAWSPGGQLIAFTLAGALYSITPEGADKYKEAGGVSEPSWSPNGAYIAGSSAKGIVVMGAKGDNVTLVRNTERGDGNPSWTPDGKRLAFDSLRNDLIDDAYARPELYVVDTAGGTVSSLTFTKYDESWGDVQVRSATGNLSFGAHTFGEPRALALAGRYTAVLSRPAHSRAALMQIFRGRPGTSFSTALPGGATFLAGNGGRFVYSADRTIRLVDVRTAVQRVLAFTAGPIVGLTISGDRVVWAENVGKHGRIRTLLLAR
jgi:Tol biopolymer transport system component